MKKILLPSLVVVLGFFTFLILRNDFLLLCPTPDDIFAFAPPEHFEPLLFFSVFSF